MAYARARKHYRAAQAQAAYERGLFIPNDQRAKIILLMLAVVIAVFVKGLLFGLFIAGRDNND